MHAIVCVTFKFSWVFLHEYNDRKIEEFKECNRFPDFCVYFKQIFSVEKKSQLYCELLENMMFYVLFNLTFRIN